MRVPGGVVAPASAWAPLLRELGSLNIMSIANRLWEVREVARDKGAARLGPVHVVHREQTEAQRLATEHLKRLQAAGLARRGVQRGMSSASQKRATFALALHIGPAGAAGWRSVGFVLTRGGPVPGYVYRPDLQRAEFRAWTQWVRDHFPEVWWYWRKELHRTGGLREHLHVELFFPPGTTDAELLAFWRPALSQWVRIADGSRTGLAPAQWVVPVGDDGWPVGQHRCTQWATLRDISSGIVRLSNYLGSDIGKQAQTEGLLKRPWGIAGNKSGRSRLVDSLSVGDSGLRLLDFQNAALDRVSSGPSALAVALWFVNRLTVPTSGLVDPHFVDSMYRGGEVRASLMDDGWYAPDGTTPGDRFSRALSARVLPGDEVVSPGPLPLAAHPWLAPLNAAFRPLLLSGSGLVSRLGLPVRLAADAAVVEWYGDPSGYAPVCFRHDVRLEAVCASGSVVSSESLRLVTAGRLFRAFVPVQDGGFLRLSACTCERCRSDAAFVSDSGGLAGLVSGSLS